MEWQTSLLQRVEERAPVSLERLTRLSLMVEHAQRVPRPVPLALRNVAPHMYESSISQTRAVKALNFQRQFKMEFRVDLLHRRRESCQLAVADQQ